MALMTFLMMAITLTIIPTSAAETMLSPPPQQKPQKMCHHHRNSSSNNRPNNVNSKTTRRMPNRSTHARRENVHHANCANLADRRGRRTSQRLQQHHLQEPNTSNNDLLRSTPISNKELLRRTTANRKVPRTPIRSQAVKTANIIPAHHLQPRTLSRYVQASDKMGPCTTK